MASTAYDRAHARAEERESRSVGEHIFIWVGWALAAAFWGAALTTMVEIFRSAGRTVTTVSAPGAPGGMAYLAMVVIAFVILGLAIAYGAIRSAMGPPGSGEAATAALYNSIERQGGEDMTSRSPDRTRAERDFR